MDLFRCVILTILFTDTIGDGFFISDGETKWTTAATQCELAKPDLIYSSRGVKADISVDIDEDVWIGYYRESTAFEYFGCAVKDNNIPKFDTKADPGQCMSACGPDKIIGIFGNECFCFEKGEILYNKQTMLPYCNKKCKHPKDVVCGGPSKETGGTTYMSLYRSIGTNISSNGDGGNCMYYDFNGFNWKRCSLPFAFVCGNDSTVWIENDSNNQNVFRQWANATVACFADNTRPSTYNNTRSSPQTKSSLKQLWTGIVRSQVINKYTTDTSHVEHANYFFLHKDKHGNIKLKLTDKKDRHATKKSICVKGSSDVGAIVGVTLFIVAVIVVVVAVVLFLRKRGFKLLFLKKEKKTPRPSMIQNNDVFVISRPIKILQSTYHTDNEEYAAIDLTTMIDNEAKNGVIKDPTESSDYAHDYFVLEKPEEEQNDSTKAEDQKSDTNPYNPYNTLSFEGSSKYDHICAGNVQAGNAGMKVSDSESTYNTTSLGNSYLKSSGGESNNAYNMAEETEDTYNHTNVPIHQMGLRPSENDYDAI